MTLADLKYDNSKHQYFEQLPTGRRVIPSVTQILKVTHPGWSCDSWYGERGRIVHRVIQLYLKGTLDPATVDPAIACYVDAFKRFMDTSGARVVEYEQMVYNASPEYAGRYDAILHIGGVDWLLDWKTGASEPWHKLQVALYANAKYGERYERSGLLYLKLKNGFRPLSVEDQIQARIDGLKAVAKFYAMEDAIL